MVIPTVCMFVYIDSYFVTQASTPSSVRLDARICPVCLNTTVYMVVSFDPIKKIPHHSGAGSKIPSLAMGQGGSNIVSGGAEAMGSFYESRGQVSVVRVQQFRNSL